MTATVPSTLASKSLGADLKIRDILKDIPKDLFEKDARKAWTQVVTNISLVVLGYAALAAAPWYLLPLLWVFQGTALTGFFVIGHDCGHRSFAKRKWVNNWVGHLAFLPLVYPFHSWRLLHDKHHNHTNKMDVDNAWQPFRPEVYDSFDTVQRIGYEWMRGKLWWMGSILHWALIHFDLDNYHERDRAKANFSNWFVIIGGAIGLSLLAYFTGPWGVVNFWLMPWLVYHFWMSTFTIVHHTLPEIPFREPEDWNEAEAQLFGTVHCEYPAWVEFLCHHINVHIPHHLSVGIPSYNLRAAHNCLKEVWGDRLVEREFNWALMKDITDNCHLYHAERSYQTFEEYKAK